MAARPALHGDAANTLAASAAPQLPEVVLWISDGEGRLRYLSPAAQALSHLQPGCSRDDWRALVHPRDRQAYRAAATSAARQQHAVVQYRLRQADGSYRRLLEHMAPLGPSPQSGCCGWAIEVPGHRAAKRRSPRRISGLGDTDALLSAISNGTRDAIYVQDRQGRLLFANEATLQLLGREREAVIGHTWDELLPESDARRIVADDLRILRGGCSEVVEERMSTPHGLRVLLCTKGPLLDHHGQVVGLFGVATDITERKAAQKTLQEGAKRLKLALDAARLSTWTVDLQRLEVSADDRLAERFGMAPALRHSVAAWRERILPEDRPEVDAAAHRALHDAAGRSYDVEFRAWDGEGRVRWIEAHGLITWDEGGRPQCAYGVCADITERKQAEQRVLDSEKQLQLITDAAPVQIARWDREGRYLFANRAHAERLGFRPEELSGRRVAEVIGPEALKDLEPRLAAALQGQRMDFELVLPAAHLGRRILHSVLVPEFDEEGRVLSLIGVLSDVTDRRRAERALHQREQEFKTLAENSPDVIMRLDATLRVLYINRAAERAFALGPAQFLGRTPLESGLQPGAAGPLMRAAEATLREGREHDFRFTLAGESPRHYSGRSLPEYARGGAAETVLTVVYDVTQEVEAQKEREALLAREQAARAQAEAAARARDQFLAIVSHELRSPLNGIQSWAHVLEQQIRDRPPIFERALAGIRTGVAQQVRLIEDLLDATRIVSGQLRLSKQPFSLRPVIEAAIDSVRAAAVAKGVTLTTRFDLAQEQVDGDPDRVQQIVWNLLDNAVKFAPPGGKVWVTASQAEDCACITVRDNGRGISPDFLPHLFDRFRQADASSTRRHDGLGLGLALVRHLVELHGGRISAHSPGPGQGATFCVHLPLRKPEPRASGLAPLGDDLHEDLPSLEGVRVLLVDDQAEVRDSLSVLLENAGAEVICAASGAEALARLEALEEQQLPHILLCDIAMPDQDGYQTLRRLRQWETDRGIPAELRMPAIALTAFALREDRIRALASGYAMHLTKPVIPAELMVVVARVANRMQAPAG